ncbi:winged helix-turn-helix domain-containing protein [Actinokineospora sp. UTMC 2448]|uniref:ArsR/SmtB family transcription factor n=1 Tax=Actinokineospora sp. UTMC 2448 TaxID=2268449 RepID=UPI002164A7D5|nr:winged helix-turn-helix domain-containing protein [Actinokineospora sp. UTMC 2448]UVS81562.1 HTH-type transcriptional regulator NmtR [Actinokineospora sp. UTMC 2448]
MLRLSFTARDVALTRFAVSPLWEVVASVRALRRPDVHTVHRPWARAVAPRLAGVDWSLLAALVPDRRIPGFVAPPPATPVPDLTVELAGLRATPPDVVRAGLPDDPALAAVRDDPPTGLDRLCAQIQAYFDTALAPYWPRIRTLVEGDVLRRARLLAEGGAQALLNDIDPSVRWADDELSVDHRAASGSLRLRGRGLLLVPSVFVWPRVFTLVAPPWQPTLRYPPRGVATLWERGEDRPRRGLAGVIGRSRARILSELDIPLSTTDLAARTGITAGAVSQHLTALRNAGLVAGHRAGRHVRYARTEAAEALLAAEAVSGGR